ncbi:transcriptional regulator [Corynebacterium sp. P3-F1]|uniref:helix-turn-helix transcriptional regulator n=1 Tax=Corynebacterium sp. P3-F1 TaxID=3059080 RepID=UPI00265D1AA9|nr:metalloregulator ArsR/SmtB family transcription factor [Corynebacterium sp. P3-F1]WKK61578.1 transcriptional regulator [Corynebacterium sp. P3-F1]
MAGAQRSTDGQSRNRIMSCMLRSGPATAADLAQLVGLSPAGVRRHIDKLLDSELVEACNAPAQSPADKPARGRPAQHYRLTESGRDSFGNGYDELALAAFAEVEELGGREAVKKLARKRAERLLGAAGDVDKRKTRDARDVEEAASDVAEAFATHGYAAETNHVGSSLQLCQHHCPVHAVAAEYPEICEAEHELIAELVGSTVAPLALIANGDGVCTTHISLARSTKLEEKQCERSGDDD